MLVKSPLPGALTVTSDMVQGFDSSSVGTCSVFVTYKGKQTSYSINIREPQAGSITSIQVSARPSRLDYNEGELFDPSGVSFFAVINNQYVFIYSGYTYDKISPLTTADTEVTFNYFGAKTTQKISVTPTKTPTVTPVPTITPAPEISQIPAAPGVAFTPTPTVTTVSTAYKKGTVVHDPGSNAVYKITGSSTVQYLKPLNKKTRAVTIPDHVTLNNHNYTITSIAAKAFKNNRTVRTVTVGNSVKSIGKQSFYGCQNLTTLKIRTTRLKLKSTGANAFRKTSARMKVYAPKKQTGIYRKIFLKRGMNKNIRIRKLK